MTIPHWKDAELLPQSLKGQRVLAAIVFTDGVGFSARMAADEENTLRILQRDLELMARLCQGCEGHVLKTTGDGLMMYFTSAVKAVECAVEIQRAIAQAAMDLPPQEVMMYRIGIHLGDVFFSETDVMGSGVNIAARLQTRADPGGICISQVVYDVVKNQLDLKTTYLGPQELKNISDPVPVYQIREGFSLQSSGLLPVQPARAVVDPELVSPYKGLKKFEIEDRDRFFGRDQFVASLVHELEQNPLILLLGASGSGKSSLVRAGVIPRLLEKWGSHLVNLVFTPDENPFESLYASLLSRYKQSDARLVRQGTPETLIQAMKSLKQPGEHWLIFIDQFEELFTLTSAETRSRFIEGLTQLIKTGDSTLKLIVTMRADFLDQFSAYPALGKLTQRQIRLMTDMQRDELWLAIKQPAAQSGVMFESGLIEEILRDVQGQAGYLPLLQYTLDLLWESERQNGNLQDRMLHARTYRELGGVRGALQKRVDQLYAEMPEAKQVAIKQIFLRLVTINGSDEASGGRAVSRRAYRSEFTGDLVNHTLKELIDQNLLVSNDSDRLQPTVEIAHEALLDSWQALKDWIADANQVIVIKHRLAEDVAHWQTLQKRDPARAEEELWSGSRLETVLELRREKAFDLTLGGLNPDENRFIDASLRHRDRQRRRTITGLVSFSAIALGLAVLALWQSYRAENQRRQALTGQIDTLSLTSSVLLASNQELQALLEALRAVQQLKAAPWAESDTQNQVRMALQQAVYGVREQNQLLGHGKPVNSVSFSPDGQLLASASDDGTVRLWRANGQWLKSLQGHGDRVYSVAFSPNGTLLASASEDKTIRLWQRDGQGAFQPYKVLRGHTAPIYRVSFSPNGKLLASAGKDKTIRVWAIDGRQQQTLTGHTEAIWGISFSPNGTTLASASDDTTVRLWTINGQSLKVLKGHTDDVNNVSFSPDGQLIASASNDRTIRLWKADGTPVRSLKGHGDYVNDIRFSPDGKHLASASWDTTIKLWSLDGQELTTLKGHRGYVWGLSFSPDGRQIASASGDTTIKLWAVNDDQEIATLRGHSDDISRVSFSPDGKLIASASADNTVRIWSMTGQLIKVLKGHTHLVNSVSFSPDGKLIASASADRTIKLWSIDGRELRTLTGHTSYVNGVSFSPDSQSLVSASADKTIKLWSVTGQALKTFPGHTSYVNSVSFSPDGKRFASGSADNTVKLWSVDGPELKTLSGHTGAINSVRFSPNGKLLASGSADGTARVWLVEGQAVTVLKGHGSYVNGVGFSPDSQLVATASADNTVKIWSVGGQELKTLAGHQGSVQSVSFSPDGRLTASASEDKTIKLWNAETLNFDTLVTRGCDWIYSFLVTNPTVKESDKQICTQVAKQNQGMF
ncbi:hypothetical protein J5X98_13130 [Leptothermofonsia sichuanensis E412]|uniref:nSTAND1 domain-containing NTPase n=1 Tax=Leptothermofonsia sichuanensis TaxID=2917832 RepID=UPI001CA61602|nr:adenylate/guanylate cyclase domain-containing protein [Leptothermofonsia sichuanensis]QZZ23191.1 hypothetical protein J5X98_13130 [Leptothermofonsia sichuanensis E412]